MPTNASPTYTTVANLSDLHKKTNSDVIVALKRRTEEYDWFDDLPDFRIIPSGNEMRLVVDNTYQPDTVAMIPDGGFEGQLTTAQPSHGTFTFVQANVRFSFTTLYQAFQNRGKAGMIQQNTQYSAIKAVESLARKIGLQTYGFSTGTKAVVAVTGGTGTTVNGVQLKNGYGSSLIPGTATADKTYLSQIFRAGDPIAIIRTGAIQEFGTVTASPSVGSGVGFIDTSWNSSQQPTANDILIAAGTVTDATLTGTDQNRWPVGFLDAMTSASLHGLTAANWVAGFADTTGGRMSFSRVEAMVNGIYNASGQKMNRMVWSQGVRRDTIAGERGSLVYNSARFNLDGDAGRSGVKDYTSLLAPTGFVFGWNDQAIQKKVLSEKPDYNAGPALFDLDKVQDKGAVAASFNFVYFRAVPNRPGLGYLSSLQEQ